MRIYHFKSEKNTFFLHRFTTTFRPGAFSGKRARIAGLGDFPENREKRRKRGFLGLLGPQNPPKTRFFAEKRGILGPFWKSFLSGATGNGYYF